MALSQRERILEACRVPHLSFVDLNLDPLLLFPLHEENRQDTVRGHSDPCLLQSRSPEGRKQTFGGSERKSEVTLKTIGPLPGHSAALRASPPPTPSPLPCFFLPVCCSYVLRQMAGTRMSADLETISQHQPRDCRVPTVHSKGPGLLRQAAKPSCGWCTLYLEEKSIIAVNTAHCEDTGSTGGEQ